MGPRRRQPGKPTGAIAPEFKVAPANPFDVDVVNLESIVSKLRNDPIPKLTKDEISFLEESIKRKELIDHIDGSPIKDVLTFKARIYRERYPFSYLWYAGHRVGALTLEPMYFYYQLQTSQDGFQTAIKTIAGINAGSAAITAAQITAWADLFVNLTIFDVSDADADIVRYAEDLSYREKITLAAQYARKNPLSAIGKAIKGTGHFVSRRAHNITGAYADLVGMKYTPARDPLKSGAVLYFGDHYYEGWLGPKYDAGLEAHGTKPSLVQRAFNGELLESTHVAIEAGSGLLLRGIGFMFLQPAVKEGFGWWFSAKSIGVLVAWHTFITRYFGSYNETFEAIDALRDLARKYPELLKIVRESDRFQEVISDETTDEEALQILIKDLAATKSYFKENPSELFTLMLLGASKMALMGYLLGSVFITQLPDNIIADIAFTIASTIKIAPAHILGAMLGGAHFAAVEKRKIESRTALGLLKQILPANGKPLDQAARERLAELDEAPWEEEKGNQEPTTRREKAMLALAVTLTAMSMTGRAAGNVSFASSVAEREGLPVEEAVAVGTLIAVSAAINTFKMQYADNASTMQNLGSRWSNLLKWTGGKITEIPGWMRDTASRLWRRVNPYARVSGDEEGAAANPAPSAADDVEAAGTGGGLYVASAAAIAAAAASNAVASATPGGNTSGGILDHLLINVHEISPRAAVATPPVDIQGGGAAKATVVSSAEGPAALSVSPPAAPLPGATQSPRAAAAAAGLTLHGSPKGSPKGAAPAAIAPEAVAPPPRTNSASARL